jgi:predicted acylesterase/phospholipase RssA
MLLQGAAACGFAGALSGCTTLARGTAVPLDHTTKASVLGIANERFFPLYGTEALEEEAVAAAGRLRKTRGLGAQATLPELQLLAVSGGGENGAFGAGLLCAWTTKGDRPDFELVTGVSTGALTAPFAFLGSRYDEQLRSVYTGLKPDNVLEQRGITAALFDDAMADNEPLFRTISVYLTEAMLAELAQNYREGRLLLIGTSDLDAQQPVIWNIGAIAASGHPRALDTIRRILLASAAIPGAFPPTMFDVTMDGVAYQELHVDGGAFAQAFLYPAGVTAQRRQRIAAGENVPPARAYIIRNGRLDPDWASTQRSTLGIASRAIATMIQASGMNDVMRMYASTQRDGVDYNLAFIGPDFTMKLPAPFDQTYMRAMFDYGYQRTLAGKVWVKQPPLL